MATKKKSGGKKPASKKSRGMWSKSKADYSEKAAKRTAWVEKAKGKPGYGTRRMKGIDGKTRTYHTKTDSRGRMRIIDNGQAAPVGYVPGHRGYYGLKRNLRITDRSSPEQKAFYAAHESEIMGADRDRDRGAIDNMGAQGQVNAHDGLVYANFRRDQKIRNQMNEKKAWFEGTYSHAGQKGRKMSRNIMEFGQDGREP